MGCCNSKNRIEDVNAEAIRKVEARDLSNNYDRNDYVNQKVNNQDRRVESYSSNKNIPKIVDNNENNNRKTVSPQRRDQLSSILEKQVEEWKTLIETLTNNKKLMSYALARPRTHFKLVSELGAYLAGCRDAHSVIEKAWLVYVWITHNIAYDVQSFFSGDYRFCSPQSVLERGLGICAGYADLYKTLCSYLGIECIRISGYSKGYGYKVGSKSTKEDHAWNAIACGSDGKLRFIESTWGAGHLNDNKKFEKKFVPHYFAVPAHIFKETHHSESFTPTDGTKKFTLEEFENCANNELEYLVLGLSCLNNTARAITRTNKNPLVIEYTAPQKIYFTTKLIDERTGRVIENAAFIQSEFSMFKDQKSKYCLVIDIPEKGRNYIFKLFAKNKQSSEGKQDNTFPMVSQFVVVREGDEESYIPQYNLTFEHGIKLKSHYSQLIKFKTNPLVMEFEVPKDIKTLFSIITMNDNKIEEAAISQINPENSRTIVQIALPRRNEKFILQIFAKHAREQGNSFGFVSQLFLIRTQSNKNDELKFCKLYTIDSEFFVYSPLEYNLTSNSLYEFRYFIKDALDVALVDSSKNWIHLDRENREPNIWSLTTALTARGKVNVFAKFDRNSSFSGICFYEVR